MTIVMGTMGLEEVNNVIQRELAKLFATHNIGSPHSANTIGSNPAAPATPRPNSTGAIPLALIVAGAPATPTAAPPNDVLRDSNSRNASRSLSDDSALFYVRREEQEVLLAADQDQEMVDEHDQRRVSPVRASPPEYQSDSDSDFVPARAIAGPSRVKKTKITLYNSLPEINAPFMEQTDSFRRQFAVKLLRAVLPPSQKLGEKVKYLSGDVWRCVFMD